MDTAVRTAAGLVTTQSKVLPLRTAGDGRVVVYVDGDVETIRKEVTANGGEVSDEDTGKVRAAVPPAKLEKLAGTKGVKEIRRPAEPVEMAIISEGVQPSGASTWHGNGKLGAGAKVGIIDVGFGRLDETQANGELPTDIPVYNGQCPPEQDSAHGTSVAEVVHDMAPQAGLFLACVADAMGFDDAARWLKDQGVQVVNVSIGFPGVARGDGSGSIGQTVAWLRANGIVVVAAAGNEGLKHMTGPTSDPDGNGWMNVFGASETLGFSPAAAGEKVTVELKWDAWPVTNEDLDLYIMKNPHKPADLNDPDLVAYSTRPQKATPGGMTPVEMITLTAQPLTYWVYVKTNGAQSNLRYDLTAYGRTEGLSHTEPAGSIAEPATSPYAIAVGAITPANAAVGTVESDSSRGPTIDGRIKPDVAGFTSVSTYTGDGKPKGGTSIAAAHVSGAAALYKSANLNLDPAQLEAALLDSSTRPRRDNAMGHGVLNLGPPQTPQPAASSAYTALATSRRVLDATLRPDETLTLRIPDLPEDTTAVALNVNGLSATAQTDIEVFADLPTGTATLPMIPQSARSVMVMATLHPRDKVVRLRNSAGDAHLTVDLAGYFANAGSTYFPTQRAIRLRQPAPTLAAGEANARPLQVRGVSGIPANATAVAVSVTTTAATDATKIRLYGRNWPSTSVFATAPGESLTYTYIVPIGDDGAIRIGNEVGTVDITVDVTGWFGPGTGARYVPLRYTTTALNSATGTNTAKKAFGAQEAREFRVTGWPRIPLNATGVAMALSAPRADARSQVASWPQEYGWSGAPALSVEASQPNCGPELGWAPATNSVMTPLGPSGVIKLRNYSSSVDTVANVSGYFVYGNAMAPPAGPTPSSHWKFDEGAGTIVSDSVGAHRATMRLGATWQDGLLGKAGRFDGVRGDAATSTPVLRTDQSFTVAVWANLANRNGAFLMGQDGVRASGFYLEYLNSGNGGDRWSFSALTRDEDNAPAVRAQGPRYPAVNSWTHVAGVYDAPAHQMRLYLNGTLAGVQDGVTLWQANGQFTMGSAQYNGNRGRFPGGVDDVRVYQTALNDSAMRDLYASYQTLPAMPMPPTGTVPNWYGWDSLDGKITGTPAVVKTREGRIDLFANGTDNKLYHKVYDGSWSSWMSIGDNMASDPAAVSWGPGRFDLFARGPLNAVYHKKYDGQWHEWKIVGGEIKYAPTVSSWGPGRLDLFVVGTDNALHHLAFDGGQWHLWESLGGYVTASPAAIAWGGLRIDIFVRGADNELHQMAWDNVHGWYQWFGLGGKLNSGPTVASWGPGRLDVFALGTDDAVHHIAWNNAWYGWYRIGGRLTSAPAALSWGWPRIDIFAKGSGDTLCHKAYG